MGKHQTSPSPGPGHGGGSVQMGKQASEISDDKVKSGEAITVAPNMGMIAIDREHLSVF